VSHASSAFPRDGDETARVRGDESVTIELPVGAVISGTVTFADGSPARGGQVAALRANGARAARARTDEKGRFRLEGLRAGEYRLRVEPAPYSDTDILPQEFDEAVAAGTDGVELVATSGQGTISGTCVAAGGVAVSGVYVSAKPMDDGAIIRTRTDAAGKFTLTGLADAQYALVAVSTRGPGDPSEFSQRYSLEVGDVPLGTTGLKLEMLRTIRWSEVVVREDGEPLRHGTLIQLREAPASPWRHVGRLGPGGSFSFGTVRSVPYDVIVLDPATGQRLSLEGGPHFTPSEAEARLVVPSGSAISGVVVGADGRPVPNAGVSLRMADGFHRHAVTDIEGRFQLTGIEAGGTFAIEAGSHAHGRAEASGIRAGDTGVRLELRPSDPLVVKLVGVDGEPRRGVLLSVMSGEERVARMRTDADGIARPVALRPGTYSITLDGADEPLGEVATGAGGTTLTAR